MKPYKTVSARAVEDTKIIKLPFSAFKIAFEKYPDAYLRVVQIVMIRLCFLLCQVSFQLPLSAFTIAFEKYRYPDANLRLEHIGQAAQAHKKVILYASRMMWSCASTWVLWGHAGTVKCRQVEVHFSFCTILASEWPLLGADFRQASWLMFTLR
jgi:hypothetical protein